MRNFDIRRLYLYVVSFATLLMIIFSGAQLIRATAEMIVSPPTPYTPYVDRAIPEPVPPDAPSGTPPRKPTPEEEAERRRQAEEQAERARQERRHFAIMRVVESGALFLIAAPLYVYHWRLIRREDG